MTKSCSLCKQPSFHAFPGALTVSYLCCIEMPLTTGNFKNFRSWNREQMCISFYITAPHWVTCSFMDFILPTFLLFVPVQIPLNVIGYQCS